MLGRGWSNAVLPFTADGEGKAASTGLLLRQQVDNAFASVPLASFGNVALACLLVFGLGGFSGSASAAPAVWLGFVFGAVGVRLGLYLLFIRADDAGRSKPIWRRGLVLTTALLGLVWGSSAILFHDPDDQLSELLLSFTLGGLAAGSITVTAAYLPMAFAFQIPVVMPLIGVLLFRHGPSEDAFQFVLAAMLALFLVFILASSSQLHRWLVQGLVNSNKLEEANASLMRDSEKREQQRQLLEVLAFIQSEFIITDDLGGLFKPILGRILPFTGSEYGFIGEVLRDEHQAPYLRTFAITDISWNEQTRKLYEENTINGFQFRNLDTLFGAALRSGAYVISHDPAEDPRKGGLPEGHPPLNKFLALPLYSGGEFVGLLGLANRPGGYDEDYVKFLWPLALTLGNLIDATRAAGRRRDAEKALAAGEALKSAILGTALDAVVTMDANGRVIEWNQAAETIFGWPAEVARGAKLEEMVIPPAARDAHRRGLERYLKRGEGPVVNRRVELTAMRADGAEFPVEIAIIPVVTEDGTVFSSYIRDISSRISAEKALREAKEEAEKSNRAKSEFLAVMSHEIRTPMNGLLGMLELLDDSRLDEIQQRYVATALEAGAGLQTLLNDMLDLARLDAGKMTVEKAPFNVHRLVRGVIEIFDREARLKGLSLAASMSRSVPLLVGGDAGRVRQIINNLISNAVKFTESGDVRLDVSEVSRTLEGVVLRFEVTDTGPGIPLTFQPHIFENFAQADQRSVRSQAGAGLGLGIVRRLVELMGGTIQFETQPGIGTRFWCDLPFDTVDPGTLPAPETGRTPLKGTRLAGLRVLVVDDSAVNRMVAVQYLAREGAACEEADSGEQAIALAEDRAFDLILMDIAMPGMNGVDAFRAIRSSQGANANTPAIALTAYASTGNRRRFAAVGMDGFVSKPVGAETLVTEVLRLLGRLDEPASPGPAVDTPGILDWATIGQLQTDLGVEVYERLAGDFAVEAARRVDAIEAAARDGRLEHLSLEAHALKGMGATFGLSALADLALVLEVAGSSADSDVALGRVGELRPLLDESLRMLRDHAA